MHSHRGHDLGLCQVTMVSWTSSAVISNIDSVPFNFHNNVTYFWHKLDMQCNCFTVEVWCKPTSIIRRVLFECFLKLKLNSCVKYRRDQISQQICGRETFSYWSVPCFAPNWSWGQCVRCSKMHAAFVSQVFLNSSCHLLLTYTCVCNCF